MAQKYSLVVDAPRINLRFMNKNKSVDRGDSKLFFKTMGYVLAYCQGFVFASMTGLVSGLVVVVLMKMGLPPCIYAKVIGHFLRMHLLIQER